MPTTPSQSLILEKYLSLTREEKKMKNQWIYDLSILSTIWVWWGQLWGRGMYILHNWFVGPSCSVLWELWSNQPENNIHIRHQSWLFNEYILGLHGPLFFLILIININVVMIHNYWNNYQKIPVKPLIMGTDLIICLRYSLSAALIFFNPRQNLWICGQ